MKRVRKYSADVRGEAIKYLEEGMGHRALAGKLGIPEATARQWSRAYAVGGAEAVLNGGSTHRIYPFETKLAVVRDRVEGGLTVRDVMVKYGIPSESSVKAWCRQYRSEGEEALRDKPRGRKPKPESEE